MPFVWERTWYSNSIHTGPLGHGWHHSYDQVVWRSLTGTVHLRLADGRLATFEPLSADNSFCAYHRAEQLELRQAPNEVRGYQVFSARERLTYHFAPVAATTSENAFCLLQAVSNAHGHSLRFTYTEQGHLRGIMDSANRCSGPHYSHKPASTRWSSRHVCRRAIHLRRVRQYDDGT